MKNFAAHAASIYQVHHSAMAARTCASFILAFGLFPSQATFNSHLNKIEKSKAWKIKATVEEQKAQGSAVEKPTENSSETVVELLKQNAKNVSLLNKIASDHIFTQKFPVTFLLNVHVQNFLALTSIVRLFSCFST